MKGIAGFLQAAAITGLLPVRKQIFMREKATMKSCENLKKPKTPCEGWKPAELFWTEM